MKQTVTLRFQSIQNLWQFRLEINAAILEINVFKKTLSCECTREHIDLAVAKYGASILEGKGMTDNS